MDRECSGPGYTDRWIDYGRFDGEQMVSAKELTLMPGAKCVSERPRGQRLDHGAGLRADGQAGDPGPVMIHFGQEPWDEVFITHERRWPDRDREHGRRAAGEPPEFWPGHAQEVAGDRRSPQANVKCGEPMPLGETRRVG